MSRNNTITANDLPKKSRFRKAINYLTKCARRVLDDEGNPKKHSFWWYGHLNRTRKFFMDDPLLHRVKYKLETKEIALEPINPNCISDEFLIHRGIVKNKEFNNIKNLSEHGVFGDPSADMPTYISPISKVAQPVLGFVGKRQDVMLLINKRALAKIRNIYIDPELIFGVNTNDIIAGIGSAYVVFGGIPESVVIGISFNVSGGKTIFTLRNGNQIELDIQIIG